MKVITTWNLVFCVSPICISDITFISDCSAEIVCANSLEYIQNNEVIMTLGNSRLVERFLKVSICN